MIMLATTSVPYPVCAVEVAIQARPRAMVARPVVTTMLGPTRAAIFAAGLSDNAHGESKRQGPHPGLEGVVAKHELHLLDEEEQPAEQGEEDHGDGEAGHAEPGVAKDGQVHHRMRAAQLEGDPPGWRRRRPQWEGGAAQPAVVGTPMMA
jgi:hypothetical protein